MKGRVGATCRVVEHGVTSPTTTYVGSPEVSCPFRRKSMMTTTGLRSLAVSVFAMTMLGCSGGDLPIEDPQPDLEALRAQVLEIEDAMNQAVDGTDCDSGMAYMADAEPIFVSAGQVIRTKDELHEMCLRMTEPRTGAVFSIDSRTATMLSSDAAVVVREGMYTIHFKEQPSVEVFLVMTTVWQREGETWKMVHLHESVPMSAPGG
jgi:ketosteroid isomerase-like protein